MTHLDKSVTTLKKSNKELDLEWPLTDDGSVFSEEEMDIVDKFANKEVVQTLKLVNDKYYLDFYRKCIRLQLI